jgi:hypothetical protein
VATPAEVAPEHDFNSLDYPTAAKPPSERKSEFSELPNTPSVNESRFRSWFWVLIPHTGEQVEPGKRMRIGFCLYTELLSMMPDAEAVAHALFDVVAAGHETGVVADAAAFAALVEKYNAVAQS